MLGDDDGGRVFDPSRNRAEHLNDPLALGAILFQRSEFKSLLRVPTGESIWLLGAAGLRRWDEMEPKPVLQRSSALPEAGIFFLRNAHGNLTVRTGTTIEHSRGHDHADALSICLDAKGKPLLIDPGTCEYVGSSDQRNVFRSTAMHNSLRVAGKDQCEPDGPFSWKQQSNARTEQWVHGETFDLFIGSHDGYRRLSPPVLHRRWIVALKSGAFLVRDRVEGEGEHQLDLSWHLGPDLIVHGDDLFKVKDTIQGLAILTVKDHDWSVSVHRGLWSPVYGKLSSAMVLNYGKRTTLPAEFVSVLLPLDDISTTPGQITQSKNDDFSEIISYHYESPDLNHSFYFRNSSKPWQAGAIRSDAEFVCMTKHADGSSPTLVFCNGTYVDVSGFREFRTSVKVQRFERTPNGISCSNPKEVTAVGEQVVVPLSVEHAE